MARLLHGLDRGGGCDSILWTSYSTVVLATDLICVCIPIGL